jgi:PAS domain S-box-containing protein
MKEHAWIESFPASITVCDAKGIILEMNAASAEEFGYAGGRSLIGSNVLDCHPEPSRTKMEGMLASQQKNIYSTEKKGEKKMVYQVPWYQDNEYAGFIEMILPLPVDMPHFIRD